MGVDVLAFALEGLLDTKRLAGASSRGGIRDS